MVRWMVALPLLVWPLWAQVGTCPAKQVVNTLLVDVRSDGETVKDLGASDFLLNGKGVTAEPLAVTAEAPMDLLILIEPHNRGDKLDGAVPLLMTSLDAEDRIAVWHYGTGVDKKTAWESDFAKVRDALLEAGRGVQLQTVRPLNAVVEALRAFPEVRDEKRKRVILLIGDEQDWSTPVRWEAVVANLKKQQVTLSVLADGPRDRVMGKFLPKINVGPGNVGEPRVGEAQGRFGAQNLARVAAESGGDALATNGIWSLEEIVGRLKERYLVAYCAEKGKAKSAPAVALSPAALAKHPAAQVKLYSTGRGK
ncbi:MAG: hypothetical protein OHK0021_02160 [Bryobacter sp.]